MADPPTPVFFGSDRLQRLVSVVIDPRDAVTKGRVPVPLEVQIKHKDPVDAEPIATKPIAARSGVYCFTDLKLATGEYMVEIRTFESDRSRYFDAERKFTFTPIPIPSEPLKRNLVEVQLLPRPAYPFEPQSTLARGRLVKAGDGSPLANAEISLTLDTVNKGFWQRTDERGEFVIFFPPAKPKTETDTSAGLKDFKFQLEFKIPTHAPHRTAEVTVKEGTAKSMGEIKFPGT